MMRIAVAAIALSLPVAVPAMAAPTVASEQIAQTRSFYLQLIHQARTDGRPRAALAYLDDFDRQHPGDLDAGLLRVNILLDLGQVDVADTALARIPATAPGAATNAVRGHIQAARGNWTRAVPFYQAAALANPTDPLLRNALGYALLRMGAAEGAIEQLRAASDLAPGDVVIRNNLILALSLAGHKADVASAIGQLRDRQAQAALRQQIIAESARLAAMHTPATGKGS